MNPRTTSSYYARQSAAAHRELGAARSDAELFRGLLVEHEAALRAAWAFLPAGVVLNDLLDRTRAALAGQGKPLTVGQAVQVAADRLEREQQERQQ